MVEVQDRMTFYYMIRMILDRFRSSAPFVGETEASLTRRAIDNLNDRVRALEPCPDNGEPHRWGDGPDGGSCVRCALPRPETEPAGRPWE